MNILNILGSHWAIDPCKLLEISDIYARHARSEKIDIAAVEARLGRPLANEPTPYTVQDGVAIVSIDGVLAKRANLLTQTSGMTSTELVARDFKNALADPGVHSVVLAIDSAGGTVDGTIALADTVYAARSSGKAVVTLASGMMASAAYWIGSASQSVYITDATTLVGSIGIITSHQDVSGAQAQQGTKTTEISAGKYKRIASRYEPLTADGHQTIQAQIDYSYSIFVDAVGRHRGVKSDTVLANMADGRIFIGQQAINAGLVDGILGMDALIAQLVSDHKTNKSFSVLKPVPLTRAGLDAKYIKAQPSKPVPLTRTALDAKAKAYIKDHPQSSYVEAVQKFEHLVSA